MIKPWIAAALLTLPLVGLAGAVALNEVQLRDASAWRIPITGFDPRDPIRGQFVQFQYDWAVEGPAHLCQVEACRLCLREIGDKVHARVLPAGSADACPAMVDPIKSSMSLIYSPEFSGRALAAGSRIFVSERRAAELAQALATRKMVVVARLTRDGRLVNERIEPAE